jgi:serine/threonine-protein kinase
MAQPESIIGTTIAGKYAVKSLLGVGGMGSVYEGRHVEIGKRVAIKIIDGPAAQSSEVAARFRREARSASAVESEHILHIFDVGEDPELGLYMVMEFLEGEDLGARLAREQRLDPAVAMSIATQVARGLAKAHGANVVHRDLKPGNIFLTAREDGSLHAKIVDFGISKLTQEDPVLSTAGAKLTRVGTAIGTPQYMSPEQAQGLPNVDHRTDVWSLGTVLYEMLAGRAPYDDLPTYEQTIIQIVTRTPPPLLSVAPWVDPRLAAVVDGTLKHNPNERTPDAATLVRQLVALSDWRSTTAITAQVALAGDALAKTLPLQGTTEAGFAMGSPPTPPTRGNSGTIVLPAPPRELVEPDGIPGLARRGPWAVVMLSVVLGGAAVAATRIYLGRATTTTQPSGVAAASPVETASLAAASTSAASAPAVVASSDGADAATAPTAALSATAGVVPSASAVPVVAVVPTPSAPPAPSPLTPPQKAGGSPQTGGAPVSQARPAPTGQPATPAPPTKFGGVDVSSEY